MTQHINTGGPAFPSQHTIQEGSFNPHTGTVAKCNQVYIELGASLRDYFAAKAMQSLLSNTIGTIDDDARNAYAIADAMLRAREGVK